MKKIITIFMIAILVFSVSACGTVEPNIEENNDIENVEDISSSFNMEKVETGKYTFMAPDNGDKKYSNGDSRQTFYTDDGEKGIVWYSLEGPLKVPKDKAAAHNITRSAGSVIKFEFDDSDGVEQATIVNEYEGEYEGLRIVTNSNDKNDCIWLSVIATDMKVVEAILDSLEW